jgi:hypothetical protein
VIYLAVLGVSYVAYLLAKRFKLLREYIVLTPLQQELVICMDTCSERFAFGSDEFNACVDACMKKKRAEKPRVK